jgi:hypothetical protein
MRDLLYHHPGAVLALQTLAACALGYISHLIQQRWYAENYLLLHIALWWSATAVALVYLFERRSAPRGRGQLQRERLGEHLRLNAVFRGGAAWHVETTSESLNDDMPSGGPLFRSICLRMPNRWELQQIKISLAEATQSASYGRQDTKRLVLDFGPWDNAWLLSLFAGEDVTLDDARAFLLDVQRVLESTDAVSGVRWHDDADLEGGPTAGGENARGASSPVR